ncbi:MAG: peptidyl-prolyl cis-trans isomerase SurA [Flavobacteriales bacterium]|jgi:peptidyl-prolyl cis-trans isomerase SurA
MKKILASIALIASFIPIFAQQGELIDKVIAVVGDEIILKSELEFQALQYNDNKTASEDFKCEVLEELMFQKLLIDQARIDSIEVFEHEIQSEIQRRLDYYKNMMGGQEAFEQFYGRTEAEWKDEFYEPIQEQLLAQKAQQQMFGNVKVTPFEVQEYFNSLPADSLPLINEQLEYSQLVLAPAVRTSAKNKAKNDLDSIRVSLSMGKSFMTIEAAKHSEDPGSKNKGGCYPIQRRGSFVPEYEAAVFSTDEGDYSEVFETVYGYHFVYVKEKRGDNYEACHILKSAEVTQGDFDLAQSKIDSLAVLIRNDSLNFVQATMGHSTDEDTKNQEGRVINPATGNMQFESGDLNPAIFFVLDKMEPNEISTPTLTDTPQGTKAWIIVKLNRRIAAHKANLKEDYLIFQNQTEALNREAALDKWVVKQLERTYVRLDSEYNSCTFDANWVSQKTSANN